jgi:hypothetical protein
MVLKQSFHTEALMKFSVLKKESDPIVMFNSVCEFFVQDTELIIQGLISDIRKIVRKEGETIDNLAIRIKTISTQLDSLDRKESESSLKEILMTAIRKHDPSAKATLETIFNSDSYPTMSFDALQVRLVNGMKFHDTKKEVNDTANFVQQKSSKGNKRRRS